MNLRQQSGGVRLRGEQIEERRRITAEALKNIMANSELLMLSRLHTSFSVTGGAEYQTRKDR